MTPPIQPMTTSMGSTGSKALMTSPLYINRRMMKTSTSPMRVISVLPVVREPITVVMTTRSTVSRAETPGGGGY
jgi:hypothetical protein